MRMRAFARDGSVDRFDGGPVMLPEVLSLLSERWPTEIQFHNNWMFGKTRLAHHELAACANRMRAPSMGGREEDGSLITTTMRHVMARSNASLEGVRAGRRGGTGRHVEVAPRISG